MKGGIVKDVQILIPLALTTYSDYQIFNRVTVLQPTHRKKGIHSEVFLTQETIYIPQHFILGSRSLCNKRQ